MDYSDRVNSKKGAGAVADRHEANVQTKQRIKNLITTQILDLDKDPYVFRNHLGLLECRLCLTSHSNEASYISHLSGKKHSMNLERRRILSERASKTKDNDMKTSMSSVEKRSWRTIGRPIFKITKIRHPESFRMGILLQAQYPRMTVKEPYFCFMSYYELSQKKRQECVTFLDSEKEDYEDKDVSDPLNWQYLVISAEPYENICVVFPASMKLEKTSHDTKTDTFWWYWDRDSGEFFLQVLFQS